MDAGAGAAEEDREAENPRNGFQVHVQRGHNEITDCFEITRNSGDLRTGTEGPKRALDTPHGSSSRAKGHWEDVVTSPTGSLAGRRSARNDFDS